MMLHVSLLYTGHVKEPDDSFKKGVGHRAGSAVSSSLSMGRLRLTSIHVRNEIFNASPNIASNISRCVVQKALFNQANAPVVKCFHTGVYESLTVQR